MTEHAKSVYTARVRTTGGRDGVSRSSDERLDIRLSPPGGSGGTDPKQLFAAGWSACFEAALGIAARRMNVVVPADPVIDVEVGLKAGEGGCILGARLNVTVPGLDRGAARGLVETACQNCPCSRATRGDIPVGINLVQPRRVGKASWFRPARNLSARASAAAASHMT